MRRVQRQAKERRSKVERRELGEEREAEAEMSGKRMRERKAGEECRFSERGKEEME